jgi:hypothetical protein
MQNRANLRARVVPLAEEGREDVSAYGSAEERLALVAELTREMWELRGWEIPTYSRAEIPVVIRSLRDKE